MNEFQIQKAIIQHLELRGVEDMLYTAVPNQGFRNIIEAVNLKRIGVKAGTSDLLFWHKGCSYALEVKAERGRPSEHQLKFLDKFRAAGGHGCVSNGLDRCLSVLETWGLIK